MQFFGQFLRRERLLWYNVPTGKGRVFFLEASQLARPEAESGEDGGSLADGVITAEVCAGEPLTHSTRLGDQDGNHALEPHFLEFIHFVFIAETNKERCQVFNMFGDFRAKLCFTPDKARCREDGKFVAVIVFRIAETSNEIADVAA